MRDFVPLELVKGYVILEERGWVFVRMIGNLTPNPFTSGKGDRI
jgi:hypothetical protein